MAKRRQVLNNVRLRSGDRHSGARFTGGTTKKGVVHVDFNLQDVLVRNSVVEPGPQNGVTFNCWDGVHVRDALLEGVRVRSQPRMGFECTDRRRDAVYSCVDQKDVVYDPQGSEAISYDGPPLDAGCTLTRVTILGAGENPAERWGAGLEINGPKGFLVDRLTVYRCRSHALNLQGDGKPAGHLFRDLCLDARRSCMDVDMSGDAQMIWARGLVGCVFSGLIAQGGGGGELAYLDNCHDLDFSQVTWIDERRRPKVTLVNGCTNIKGLPV